MRLRTPAALAAVLSLVAVAATTATAASAAPVPREPSPAATAQVVIGEFEPGGTETWDLHTTGTATGELTIEADDPASGAGHGRLVASVPTGTLEAARWPGQIDATALELAVRTSDVDLVTVRVQDSSGQAHQQRLAVDPDAEGWQSLRIADFTSGDGYLHFGGADDGVWHGPLRAVSVILDTWSFREGSTSGTLDIDRVVADAVVTTPAVALQTLVTGNVFHVGDDVAVGLTGDATDIAWTVRDGYGTVVDQGEAAASELEGTLPLDVTQPGWYAVDVVATTATGTRELVGTDLAVLQPLAEDFVRDPRLAVATHYGQSWPLATAALVADAGFGMARDEAYWAAQETTPGEIVWQDKVVAYEQEFADLGLAHFRVLSYGNPLYFEDEAPTTPEGREAFARYALATVEELGVEGNYFEVWNEWNWRDLDGAAGASAAQYVALLQVVHDTIKAEYPDAVIVGPALAPMNDWQGWFTEFADLGGLDLVDAVSTHPYTYPDAPESSTRFEGQWEALRTIMDAHGAADLPLMISETGWPTSETSVGIDEATQAQRQVRGTLIALADGIQNVTIYDFMDDGTDDAEVEHRFGIIRNTDDDRGAFVPKPAYVANAVLNRQLAGLGYDSSVDLGPDAFDTVFSDGDRIVHAAWATTPTTAAFAATGPVTVTGIYGDVTELAPDADGLVHVSLGEQIVYVEGPVTTASLADTYTLEVDREVVGTLAAGRVLVDNAAGDAAEITVRPIGGDAVTADVAAGASATVEIGFAAQDSAADRTYTAVVDRDGVAVALLRADGRPTPALTLTGVHGITDEGQTLRLRLTSAATEPVALDGVDVTIDGETTRVGEGETVPPGSSLTLVVPVDPQQATAWTAVASPQTGSPATASGTLRPVDDTVDVPAGTVELDGTIDAAVAGLPAQTVGETEAPAIPGWEGPEDLSAQIWLTHDEDNLYLSVLAQDDTHAQSATGGDIWQGDGLQIGLVAGAPGEDPVPQELGVALTNGGEVVLHRWAPADQAGVPEGVSAVVVRDEEEATTTYEVAIPWESVGIDDEGRLLASTVVLNENDGTGRAGWLSWGLGLAETKNAALFHALALQPAVVDTTRPVVELVAPTTMVSRGELGLEVAATDDVGLARIVANVYQGGTLVESTQTRVDGAASAVHRATLTLPAGEYTIRYNAHDTAGNVSRTQTQAFVVDRTRPTVELQQPSSASGTNLQIEIDAADAYGIDRIVANIYQGSTLITSTQIRIGGEASGVHQATVTLPPGSYTVRYNARDVAGNVSVTSTVPFTIEG